MRSGHRSRWGEPGARGRAGALTALAAALLLVGACGTPCQQIRADREAFAARRAGSADPHLVVALPFALLDRLAAERLGAPRPVPLRVPGLGAVGRALGEPALALRGLRFRPARPDRVGVELTVELLVGGRAAATLTVDVEAQPAIDLARRRLELVLRGDDLRAVRPRLGRDAQERLATFLRVMLPPGLRRVLPPRALTEAADLLLATAVERGWPVLRDEVLAHLGAVARIGVALPDLPLARLRVQSEGDARGGSLHVAVTTTLPVARGLVAGRALPRPRGERVILRVAGSLAAELGNLGMETGRLPSRFDREGQATPDGPFEAALAWEPGRRPLDLRLWQLAEPCLSARLRAAVQVTVADGAARVDVTDGVLTDVRGPALIEVGAWLHSLWADAITFTTEVTARTRLRVAGTTLDAALERVRVGEDELVVELGVAPARR